MAFQAIGKNGEPGLIFPFVSHSIETGVIQDGKSLAGGFALWGKKGETGKVWAEKPEGGVFLGIAQLTTINDEYRWLVGTTLSRVTVTTPGKKAVRLSDMDAVADHFRGRGSELCAAMLTVWRKEKLSPFERAQEVEEGATAGP